MKSNKKLTTEEIRYLMGAEQALDATELFGNEEETGNTPSFHFTTAAAERDDRSGDAADRWLAAMAAGNKAAMAAAEAAAVAEAKAGILY